MHGVQYFLMGSMQHSGVLGSKVICRPHELLTLKWEARTDPIAMHQSIYMAEAELAQPTYHVQVKNGGSGFYGVNFIASVTPQISAGAELFYLASQRRSGMGAVLRYSGIKSVAAAQVCSRVNPVPLR
jgi:mitochondrial import receptor subunit TOM40